MSKNMQNRFCKLMKQTNGFTKKPSVKEKNEIKNLIMEEKQEDRRKKIESIKDKESYKFGCFYPKGYNFVKIFKTREEAERFVEFFKKKYGPILEVREILGW